MESDDVTSIYNIKDEV